MTEPGRVLPSDFGRETANGEPHRAERTACNRRSSAVTRQGISSPGVAGASTVGLVAGRTRPKSPMERR